MTKYVGTITAEATFVGTGVLSGDTATVMVTDKATAILTINPSNHKFTGTIDQVITVSGTANLGSTSIPFSTTQDTGPQTISGQESHPVQLTFSQTGTLDSLPYTVSVAETFKVSKSSISVTGTANGDIEGNTGTLSFSGTLQAHHHSELAGHNVMGIVTPDAAISAIHTWL